MKIKKLITIIYPIILSLIEDTKLDLKDKFYELYIIIEKPFYSTKSSLSTKSLYKSKYGIRSRDIIAQAQSGTGKTKFYCFHFTIS